MVTLNQLVKVKRRRKCRKYDYLLRGVSPQKKGVCIKVLEVTPKKPNSAKRKVAKVKFARLKRKIYVYIPGIGHTIREHAMLLIRGGRTRDLPGLWYKIIRGKYDASCVENRITSRSKYGVKKEKKKEKVDDEEIESVSDNLNN